MDVFQFFLMHLATQLYFGANRFTRKCKTMNIANILRANQ